MKKSKYNKNDNVYFIRIKYIDGEYIKLGDKDFYISTKCFFYIDEGYIIHSFYNEAIKSYLYNIKKNNDEEFTGFEKEIFVDKEKALLYCRKKNKNTCKCISNELKSLKRII